MDANNYKFLLQYSNPLSLLVVTSEGQLTELNCPFEVEVIKNVQNLMIGEVKEVVQVKLATNNLLVYLIEEKPYFYYYFNIIV